MHTPWPLVDILALLSLRRLTAADVIRLVSTYPTADAALDTTMPQALFADAWEQRRTLARQAVDRAEASGTAPCSWWDVHYPAPLRTITNPPALVWVRGALDTMAPGVAIVGTRSCTAGYGKPVTEHLVDGLVAAGCCIVSGLAAGVDTIAHERTLRRQGVTVAVVASGTDRIAPVGSRRLAERIVDHGGAIVSEYRCGQAALPPYFPQRNRIISGISAATVVVESAARGGALITADFALAQGRHLWAVPGPITSSRSEGTNALLASGRARLCRGPADVVVGLGLTLGITEHRPRPTGPMARILACLDGVPRTADAIAGATGLAADTVLTGLLQLELDGWLDVLPGQRYAAKP